jgi:serine/threonine-protein phosphatase 2B catalytic subunit
MLIAILNCCTKEELEEEEEETPMAITPDAEPELSECHDVVDSAMNPQTDMAAEEEATAKQRAIIKTKILAVGRMSRVFALLRYVELNSGSRCARCARSPDEQCRLQGPRLT